MSWYHTAGANSFEQWRLRHGHQHTLLLQDFRNGDGAFLADFFSRMTFLGELSTAFVIMAILYWCVSKDFGAYPLMGWSGNRLVNGVLKVTVCAYRPRIRDARIVPTAIPSPRPRATPSPAATP